MGAKEKFRILSQRGEHAQIEASHRDPSGEGNLVKSLNDIENKAGTVDKMGFMQEVMDRENSWDSLILA